MCPIFEKNPNSCPSGGILYKGVRGLNVHYSRAHKTEHHAGLEAKASQSAPSRKWSDEEIKLLAHAEFIWRCEHPAESVDMAQKLIDLEKTERSYAAVRKIRTAPKYKEFYATLGAPPGVPKGKSVSQIVGQSDEESLEDDPLNTAFAVGLDCTGTRSEPASQNSPTARSNSSPLPPNVNMTPTQTAQPRANGNPFVDSDSDEDGDRMFRTPPPSPIAANPSAVSPPVDLAVVPPVVSQSDCWADSVRAALVSLETSIDLASIVPSGGEVNQASVDSDYSIWLPPRPQNPSGRLRTPPRKLPTNKRSRRKALYSRLQRMYKRNRAAAADTVLDGSWEKDGSSVPLDVQDRYWRNLLETPSRPDSRNPEPIREVQWELLSPISQSEVKCALKLMKRKTSPGLDGLTVSRLKSLPIDRVVGRFNLWLLAGCIPSSLREGYTALIPKEFETADPAKFRPITVSSTLIRLYHKVLAARFEQLCPTSVRQKAFKAVDGCGENTAVLQSLLKHATDPGAPKELYVAFLDVRKAFDSVSHESLVLAARRAGIPEPLLSYVVNFYASSSTRLRVDGKLGDLIRVMQGVRQGDPLSCWLFNIVIDWSLTALNPAVGVSLQSEVLSHLAFADDLCLPASTRGGLQTQIDAVSAHLRDSGLNLNAAKCATISVCVTPGRTKTWYCSKARQFTVAGESIPSLDVSESYRYLGLQIRATGTDANTQEVLGSMLRSVTAAPLKPQQRLWILRNKLLPKLQYALVLGEASLTVLRHVDCTVRAAVRKWLKLPNDTPKSAFYADVRDGGLGVQSFEHVIPSLKVRRFCNISSSSDPVVREVCRFPWFRREIAKWRKPTTLGGLLTTSTALRRQAFAHDLLSKVDGAGLRDAPLVQGQHSWLVSGNSMMSGAKFCAAVGLRLGTLPTRARGTRGRPEKSGWCDCCGPGHVEQLTHVLQVCPRTHGPRIARHDRVLSEVAKVFSRLGYQCTVEPHLRTPVGLRKPDLVVYGEGKPCVVLDVAITKCNLLTPDQRHIDKQRYYAQPDNPANSISTQVEALTGQAPVIYSSCVLNWRGLFSPASAADLRSFGFTERDIGFIAALVVEQGAVIHRVFNTSTHVVHHARGLRT